MKFSKMHGLGNDYVVLGASEASGLDLAAAAIAMCDRRFGVGADGLVAVLESNTSDCRMRIFNIDGSEAEMCGNGVRCAARYYAERVRGENSFRSLTVETLAGEKKIDLKGPGESPASRMTVDMGEPILDADKVPTTFEASPALMQDIEVEAGAFKVSCVSMGNPHAIIFCDDVNVAPLETAGPQIEKHSRFPRKTNVEFCRVLNEREIDFRVWERGVGETLACGTGACASVVAASLNRLAGRKVVVHLRGGDLEIEWRDDNRIAMTGPADFVFDGEWIGPFQ